MKSYKGFETLWVLPGTSADLPALKENQNTVLALLDLDSESSLTQRIDLIISAGFDGVYMIPGKTPAGELLTLSHYARMSHPDFLIIIENIHEYKNPELNDMVDAFALVDML